MFNVKACSIKDQALKLGFHLVGIAPAIRLSEADHYIQWLERGYFGEMNYLARHAEKREDCRTLFPAARSVIVCGLSYHSPPIPSLPNDAAFQGYISRYARGNDYHHILKHKLYALLEWLQSASTKAVKAKVCVDTVPLLERLYGHYAGLGWIGKNGALINQHYGSWFFLGEIVSDLELEYDAPVPDGCGDCVRCLEACPTGAFVAPRILDARRCVSYLTIECRGSIPEVLRPMMGNTVFGCDRCQDVCLWNQQAAVPDIPAFAVRPSLIHPELAHLSTLSPQDFRRMFHHAPITRATLSGLLRNTAVALGNSGNMDLLPVTQHLCEHPVSVVRSHAQWARHRLSDLSENRF